MKNNIKTICLILSITVGVIIGLVVIVHKHKTQQSIGKYTIGIIQTISHPALDSVRKSIETRLSEKIGGDVVCIVQNAEGSIATAQTIAKSMHEDCNIQAIATIGTLATQAAMIQEKIKPIIYSAVSDPSGCGISKERLNVVGISDCIDVNASADALQAICPSAQTVAILYNPSETNSVTEVERMIKTLEIRGLTPIHVGMTNESEALTAVKMALREGDVLWMPTDNTAACVMDLIGKEALKAKKPAISTFLCGKKTPLPSGILAVAGGVDYPESGKVVADLIVQILIDKKEVDSLIIPNSASSKIYIHEATAHELNISIPHTISSKIIWVK